MLERQHEMQIIAQIKNGRRVGQLLGELKADMIAMDNLFPVRRMKGRD